jgi:Uma2 family endonuclease
METTTLPKLYSQEEYLNLEEKFEFKNEYNDGEIIPMTGASLRHNQIIINLIVSLSKVINEDNWEIFANDLRLWIPQYNQYTYPDVMIVKDEPILAENRTDTITNPSIIFEILSKSTSNRDRGEKFNYYRSISEFQEYILIDQYQVHIEHFSKTSENSWLFTESKEKDGILRLVSLNCEINHQDIYKRVIWEN